MRRDCWHDGKLMNIRERFVVEYIDRRIFCYIFVYSAGGKIRGSLHKLLIRLAPRPGLEPGTCGLTVRRSRGRNKNNNQVLMCFSVGSVFGHLMAFNTLG